MSQTVITTAFEALKAQQSVTNSAVVLDEFVFANVPGLSITDPINPAEALPPAAQIVHRTAVAKTGVVNDNAVVYSVTLGAEIGDFDFNWVGLTNKATNTLAMIVHAPVQSKVKNAAGKQGNVLTRSFLMEYDGAKKETQITTPAGTWQIDFTARLAGMDERQRVENVDIYGAGAFIGEGFLVKRSGNNYTIQAGAGYVGGLRAVLTSDKALTVSTKPTKVWVDVCWQGTLTSVWQVESDIQVNGTLANYVKDNVQHYVFAVAQINADGSVTDLRKTGGLADEMNKKQPLNATLTALSGRDIAGLISYLGLTDSFLIKDYWVDVNLNSLSGRGKHGIYAQPYNNKATVANNYPEPAAGVLLSLPGPNNGIQFYITLNNSLWSRRNSSSNIDDWGTWVKQVNTIDLVAAINNLVDSAPAALNTLGKIANALNGDPNFSNTMNNALALKAPLASPALTGAPTAPTPPVNANSTQLATTAFVRGAIAALVNSSPDALDTLKELADALGNDPNFAATMANALGGKQPKDSTLSELSGKDVAGLLNYLGLKNSFLIKDFYVDTNLNWLRGQDKYGIYAQPYSVKATAANNYPESKAGVFLCLPGPYAGMHIYITTDGRFWHRQCLSDTNELFSAWVAMATKKELDDGLATKVNKSDIGSAAGRNVGTGANQLPDMGAFGSNLSERGFQRLPGGMIIQWGYNTAGGGGAYEGNNVSYPISFPNKALTIIASYDNGFASIPAAAVSPVNKASFNLRASAGGSNLFYWMAIGY